MRSVLKIMIIDHTSSRAACSFCFCRCLFKCMSGSTIT